MVGAAAVILTWGLGLPEPRVEPVLAAITGEDRVVILAAKAERQAPSTATQPPLTASARLV